MRSLPPPTTVLVAALNIAASAVFAKLGRDDEREVEADRTAEVERIIAAQSKEGL